MSADTGCSTSVSKRRSRFVRIPTRTPSRVGDRDARDLVVRHQLERVADERVGRQRDRLDDHPGLGALHLVDLGDLVLDREVAVDDADAALARERDREPRLGDGVHRRRDDRDAELDRARQARARRDVVRQHARLGRHEQDVVEGEAFLGELPVQGDEPLQLVLAEFDAQGTARVPPCPTAIDPERPNRLLTGAGYRGRRCARCSPLPSASRPRSSMPAAGGTHPQTVYARPSSGTISAFAQDGSLVAWFAPAPTGCNSVHVLSLANGLDVVPAAAGRRAERHLPLGRRHHARRARARRLDRRSGRCTQEAPIPFDYLLGAGAAVGERNERRFQELAHTTRGAGLWLGGIAGDGDDARLRRHLGRLRGRGRLPRRHGPVRR